MTLDDQTRTEHTYPYWSGWHVVGCAVLFFGLVGAIGVALLPTGYEKVQNGQLPTGVALMVMGVLGIPTLVTAFWTLFGGVRNTFRPPLLRVTATALVLPLEARGDPPRDEDGELISNEPPHPETVPLVAIRWVRRAGPPFKPTLEIAHALSAPTLHLVRDMMRRADFDELESVLRAAIPEAFAGAPPTT